MKSLKLILSMLFLCVIVSAQSIIPFGQDSTLAQSLVDTNYMPPINLNFFDSEQLDVFTNGFIRSTTDIFRINIGNPEKFYLPLYLLIGTTAQLEENSLVNEKLAFDIINTKGGLINAGFFNQKKLFAKDSTSSINATYQFHAKYVNGYNHLLEHSEKMIATQGAIGILINTKAWDPSMQSNYGKMWVTTFISYSNIPNKVMGHYFKCEDIAGLFAGNIESGIMIQDGLSLKFGYYKYLNHNDIAVLKKAHMKLACNMVF